MLDSKLRIPKYKQIIQAMLEAISNNIFKPGEKLPSIYKLSAKYSISRDTAVMAYQEMRAMGIIYFEVGKGYFLSNKKPEIKRNVFLMLCDLSAYLESIYLSLKKELGNKANIDIYYHHFNPEVFESLISNNVGKYTDYVILPFDYNGVKEAIRMIPEKQVYILDRGLPELREQYPSVCQNFQDDIYHALTSGMDLLEKYNELIFVFPRPEYFQHPEELIDGFRDFCKDYNLRSKIIENLKHHRLQSSHAYVVIHDYDLVDLMKRAKTKELTLGKDFGIISYNDIPLKEVVGDGVTTISTDFKAMGKQMAKLILQNKKEHIWNKCNLIRRNSL